MYVQEYQTSNGRTAAGLGECKGDPCPGYTLCPPEGVPQAFLSGHRLKIKQHLHICGEKAVLAFLPNSSLLPGLWLSRAQAAGGLARTPPPPSSPPPLASRGGGRAAAERGEGTPGLQRPVPAPHPPCAGCPDPHGRRSRAHPAAA